MTTYAVIDKALAALQDPPIAPDAEENPARVYRYAHTAPVEWSGMEFATHDHIAQPDESVPDAPVPTGPRRLTKTQFRDRFTPQEKVGIEFASLDPRNPEATLQDRLNAAQLRVFLDDVRNTTPDTDGTSIDLDDPRTISAVQMLEGAGLIAAGRAAEILGAAE